MNSMCKKNTKVSVPSDEGLFCRDKVCCPICKTSFDYEFVNSSCYQAEPPDLSMKPRYSWKKRIWSRCLPEMFYIIRCRKCLFCSDSGGYNDPVSDLNLTLPMFSKRLKETMAGNDPVLSLPFWSGGISDNDEPFVVAVRHHLIAIYLLRQFGNVRDRDSLRLGKYSLHLSWLLQDIDRSGAKTAILSALDFLRGQLAGRWDDAPLTVEIARRQSLDYYSNCFYLSNIPAQRHVEHNILMIMVRLNLLLEQNREAEELVFKSLRRLDAQLAEPRRQVKDSDADTQLMAQTRIVEINSMIADTQQLLEIVKEHHRKSSTAKI